MGNGASGSGEPTCDVFISHYGGFVDTVQTEPLDEDPLDGRSFARSPTEDACIAPLEPLDKDPLDGRSFARSPTEDACRAPLETLDKDPPDGRSYARSPTEDTGWLDAMDDARLDSWISETKGATFTGGCKGSLQYGVATAYLSRETTGAATC